MLCVAVPRSRRRLALDAADVDIGVHVGCAAEVRIGSWIAEPINAGGTPLVNHAAAGA